MLRADELPRPQNEGLGCEVDARDLLEDYVVDRLRVAGEVTADLHVIADCANGSAGPIAGRILAATGARVDVLLRHAGRRRTSTATAARLRRVRWRASSR